MLECSFFKTENDFFLILHKFKDLINELRVLFFTNTCSAVVFCNQFLLKIVTIDKQQFNYNSISTDNIIKCYSILDSLFSCFVFLLLTYFDNLF